jgi:hypothetical protein
LRYIFVGTTRTPLKGRGQIKVSTDPNVDPVTIEWDSNTATNTYYIIQNITDETDNTPVTATVRVTNYTYSDDNCYVEQISCVEIPRSDLDDFTTALDTDCKKHGSPIFYDAVKSVNPINSLLSVAHTYTQRGALFHQFNYHPFITQSEAWVPAFIIPPEVLGRFLFDGDTTRTVRWAAWGLATSTLMGHKGWVKATSASGGFDMLNLPDSEGWTVQGGFEVNAEDMAANDGRRDGGSPPDEGVVIECCVDDAVDTVAVCGISIGEYND